MIPSFRYVDGALVPFDTEARDVVLVPVPAYLYLPAGETATEAHGRDIDMALRCSEETRA